MGAPILVTGGAGFVGTWLVRRLLEAGETVRVLDLPQARWAELPLDQVERLSGDIRDRAVVNAAVRGCRAVYHLAGVPYLWAQPRGLFSRINYRGTVHVIDEAVRAGCRRIVHVSSATIWPLTGQSRSRWGDALGPYCQSKLRAERYALHAAAGGAPVVVVSPTLPVGPGDYRQTPPTRMLLEFCRGRREYVDMNISVIDVRDAAEGLFRALESGQPGQRYLLGNLSCSLLNICQRLAAISGSPVPSRRVPYVVAVMTAVVMEWWADVVSGKAPAATVAAVRLTRQPRIVTNDADLRRLGVSPRPLDTTLSETVAWFREVGWLN